MGFLKDFKTFAVKGNLADVAIAFVMGAAFNKVITTFTTGLISPIVGLLTGSDLNGMQYVVRPEVKDAAGKVTDPGIIFKYGAFMGSVLDFIIIAFVCFIFIKALLRKDPNATPDPTPSEALLTEIRDLLKNKN